MILQAPPTTWEIASLVLNGVTMLGVGGMAFAAGRLVQKVDTLDRDLSSMRETVENLRGAVGTRRGDNEGFR